MWLSAIDELSYSDVESIVKAIRKFFRSLGLNRNEIQIEIRLSRDGVLVFNVFPYGSRAWELLFITKGITCEKLESALKKMIWILLPWLPHPGLIDVHVEYSLGVEFYGFLKKLVHKERFLLPRQKHHLPRIKYSILEKQLYIAMRILSGDLYPLLFDPHVPKSLLRRSNWL
jgi:hypothetical protein